ncbi:gamma-1-syntrophin-like [Diaphorina citri]|uniref:Gamma-1-syntrophin-like n=1 Tax=Diaphorina citri TaxID=121845 RepID=A0A3Q0IXJ5_DIACI|nr:gamma-1-syntrophin-like [Diaphorina citri]
MYSKRQWNAPALHSRSASNENSLFAYVVYDPESKTIETKEHPAMKITTKKMISTIEENTEFNSKKKFSNLHFSVDNNQSNIKESIQEPLDNERVIRTTNNVRPSTLDINCTSMRKWSDVITVPLMMAYITRYMYGTDKLRPNAFEIRGLNGSKTGIIHCEDSAILSQWLKYVTDNIMALTNLQIKLFNRNLQGGERVEYMGWVNEGILNRNTSWQNYRPRFLCLKGTEVFIFDNPPLTIDDLNKCKSKFKVYQSMLRIIKESENVDERQHCFLLQTCGENSKYFSVETRHELLRIESAWHTSICTAVIKLGVSIKLSPQIVDRQSIDVD